MSDAISQANNRGEAHSIGGGSARPRPSPVVWQTEAPINLAGGYLSASGYAIHQVRSTERAAGLGGLADQASFVQGEILQALASVLDNMAPGANEIAALQDDIATATLIMANEALAAHGISLLDLQLFELTVDNP